MPRSNVSPDFVGADFVKSVLTGELIVRGCEAYRHEQEIRFLSSLSKRGLEEVLIGLEGTAGHRSIMAVRGPAEVKFLRSEIILFRAVSEAAGVGFTAS